MALMYPWATKEYILWQMTIGQLFLYHNTGIDLRNPRTDKRGRPLPSAEEVKAAREEMKRVGLLDELQKKYGDV